MAAAVIWVPVARADGFSCANTTHDIVFADGASPSTNTGINGVSSVIYVPFFTDANLQGQSTILTDVASVIEDSAVHFFQFGWYVGSASQLPYATVPTVFVGEGVGSTGVETLTKINVALPRGTYQGFQLKQNATPTSPNYLHYQAYYNGSLVWTSTLITTIEGTPRFVGETNFDCADMYGLASTSSGAATLKGHRESTDWSLWVEHWNDSDGTPKTVPSCWNNGRVNGLTATAFVFDLC